MINKLNDKHRIGKLLPFPQMKIYLLKMLFTVVIITAGLKSNAQVNKAIDVTSKGLQIGQQVPDITISNLHNYNDKNDQSATSAKLSDFKGKLLILDFWATWCGACLSMVPRMDSLQKKFAEKIQFLSVTYQSEKDAIPFYKKFERQNSINSVVPMMTSDIELTKLFPHRALPHYVWIDDKGRMIALTGLEQINEQNILAFIKSGSLNLARKKDLQVDYNLPLFLNSDNKAIIKTQSVLTGYMDGLGSVSAHNVHIVKPDVIRKITATNYSMIMLYQLAMGKGTMKYSFKKTIVDVRDTSKLINWTSGQKYRQWLNEGSGFCYELIAPLNMADPFQVMEQDLNRYFTNYKVAIEKRKQNVLVLKRTSDKDLIKSKGGTPQSKINAIGCTITNKRLSSLNSYVNTYLFPVIDETDYKDNVDVSINADMNSIEEINRALSKYNLIYSKEPREIEFLVVKDKAPL